MKRRIHQTIMRKTRLLTFAASLCLGLLPLSGARAATLIDLSKPVSESIASINGIYWSFDSVTGTPTANKTPDLSASGYEGTLEALGGALPTQVGGVDRAGASGFGTGLALKPTVTTGNPRVYRNMPQVNNLGMQATDFSGGMWLRLDAIQTGAAQTVVLMDRGVLNSTNGADAGHWGFFLVKDVSDKWRIAFQSGSGTANSTGYHSDIYQSLNLQDGAWHHLGFSYDYRADGDNEVTFWLDGVSVGTALLSVDITTGASGASTRRFSVGERATTGYISRLDGRIDDLFVTTGIYGFQAIPEPGTYALLALGVAVVLHRRRSLRK